VKIGQALQSCGVEPREARLLLAGAAGFSQASLVAFPEREIPADVQKTFLDFTARRGRGEPVAYILGRKEFYGLDLAVNPAVLIPRPETELLVDLILQQGPASFLDLGTGSGAIALAIKRHRPDATVIAVDSDLSALLVAKRNATKLNLKIDFRHGRWFEPVAGEQFELIASNPPYVASGDPCLAELRFEPREALLAGTDGLDCIRAIVRGAPAHLAAGGWLLLEHGMGQDRAVRDLLAESGLEAVATWPDLAGIARVSGGKLK